MAELRVVRLRNGADEAEIFVTGLMVTLRDLIKANPIAFYEAVMIARNPKYKPWGDVGKDLERWALLRQGEMHDSTRNVILSAVTGQMADMCLRSPIVEAQQSS